MNIRVSETTGDVGRLVAHRVAEALRRTPDLVLGLPAGWTPVEAYAELVRSHESGDADFSRATVFLLDEFVGLAPSHPASFRRFLSEHLLSRVNVNPARAHGLNGLAADLDEECDRYETAIAAAGGLGLLLLGIGPNGHLAFNEPGESLVARTHRASLAGSTRHDNAGQFGGDITHVPQAALSIGMGAILRAGTVLLIATGDRKATAIQRMVRGPLTTQLPASLLQLHRRVEVYLDRPAASAL